MSQLRERIETRLRERLASICADNGPGRPNDALSAKADPLFCHLDELIGIVERTQDYSTEPYRNLVREVICVRCHMEPNGYCPYGRAVGCVLDEHFAMIVATIEAELRSDPGLA